MNNQSDGNTADVGRHVTREEFFYVIKDNYDEHAELAIPGYKEMHSAMVDFLTRRYRPEAPLRLLDLGAGTGKTTACILDAFPDASAVCIDLFGEMLAHAEQRLSSSGVRDRARLVQADFMKEPLGSEFDVCVSALAVHHQDGVGKKSLFRRIERSLKPGGHFCMIDWVRFDSEQMNEAALDAAEAHVRRAAPRIADDWVQHWRELNRPDTERELCEWLRDAGFSCAFCAVRHFGMAFIYASK